MENNNYEKSTNLIIKSLIDGWQTMLVFLFVGLAEVAALVIIALPIMFVFDALHAPMPVQWFVMYLLLLIIFIVFSFIGWAQGKMVGVFITLINIIFFIVAIIAG